MTAMARAAPSTGSVPAPSSASSASGRRTPARPGSSGSRWSGPRKTPGAGARRRPSASSGTGDGEGVGLAGDADEEPVGGAQGLHVELAGGVLHPGGGHGKGFQLRVVGGGGHLGPGGADGPCWTRKRRCPSTWSWGTRLTPWSSPAHGLHEDRGPGGGNVMNQAGEIPLLLRLHGDHEAAVPLGDDGLLKHLGVAGRGDGHSVGL